MKKIILLVFILLSFTAKSQNFYTSGNCKAGFKFEANYDIKTFAPATVLNFYDTSSGNVKQWYWDFGNNEYSREQNPVHIFNHPIGGPNVKINPYRTITLTIVTDTCKSTFSQTINIIDLSKVVQQNCIAQFKYFESARDSVSATAAINFVNGSEGNNLKYLWQFGDGTTSTEKEPVKKFGLKQTEYKVCLTVTGVDSCVNTFCDVVYLKRVVNEPPKCQVDFWYNLKDMLMSPLPSMVAEFYSKVYPQAKEYYWEFGDGATSSEANPTHIYIKKNDSLSVLNPYREVCLTVVTADGCKVRTCAKVPVFGKVTPPDPVKCQAAFKYYIPTDLVSIPEVTMIKLMDVTEGEVAKRMWKFENGKTSTEKEPLVSFSIFQPVHKVCLTITMANGCESTWCSEVYVKPAVIGPLPPVVDCPYKIKIDGGFPIQMSSCAGWASAKIYNADGKEVIPKIFSWSTGDTLSKASGLCPTKTYAVKALMPEGCVVYAHFILNTDGSVTETSPANWSLTGSRDNLYIRTENANKYQVEWRLCDGTIVKADSVPLNSINCGGTESNYILKDSMGNLVYSESIALKGSITGIQDISEKTEIKMWPNPVSDKLNISYSGGYESEIRVELMDMMGRQVLDEYFTGVFDGREINIDTGRLEQGIYICRIIAGDKMLVAKKISRK